MPEQTPESTLLRGLNLGLRRLGATGLLAVLVALATGAGATLAAVGVWLHGGPWGADVLRLVASCTAAVALVLAGLVLHLLGHLNAARAAQALNAGSDAATGMLSRRHFMAAAEREWSRCRRYGQDGALLLLDTDHFARVQELHGTECTEALLRQIAGIAALSLRASDLLARHSDQQFALFLPNTDSLGALDVAERIREQVAANVLRWFDAGVASTVSIGVASVGVMHISLEALMQDTTAALAEARAAGRNCVRSAPLQPRAVPQRLGGAPRSTPRGKAR